MNSLKISFLTAAVFAMAIPAGLGAQDYQGPDPVGTLSYALPQTTLTFEVTAQREQFYAGPYAKYAKKYLGVDARLQNESTCRIKEIRMTPYVEADQSRRFVVTPGSGSSSFLQLSAQGLIAVGDGNFGKGSFWRFSTPGQADFSGKGVNSNLTSESATLYRNVKNQSAFNTVAIQQDMVVEKPLEQRAQEAAETIIQLRRKKIDIVTGNTDATFSGEALGAALTEIDRMEKEYLSLFIGYSDIQDQTMKFDVVPTPSNKNQVYVAFRVSDAEGLVASDNMSGKPYLLELKPQAVSNAEGEAKAVKGSYAVYRIPAICAARLTDGVNVILQDRIPVYQLGSESTFNLAGK